MVGVGRGERTWLGRSAISTSLSFWTIALVVAVLQAGPSAGSRYLLVELLDGAADGGIPFKASQARWVY